MVERDLAKVEVAGSTPVSRSKFSEEESRDREVFFHPAIRRGTQVVRERSAKPLCVGSIPTRASKSSLGSRPTPQQAKPKCQLALT